MKKECTVEEARLKAETYCAMSEHCTDDVCRKLEQWGAPLTAYDSILEHLKKEKYVDDRRYAIAFVRDKYRFNQWGRMKIAQSLRSKHNDSESINLAMEEIDEGEYQEILLSLLRKKLPAIKAKSDYERNGKLIRFAAGHGYCMDEILLCLKQIGCEDDYFD